MNWNELAPWIAIAFTLALSILVPLFTQIANNHHQRKMQQERYAYEERQKRIAVFDFFLTAVGGVASADGYGSSNNIVEAGSAVHKLYVYAPAEWFDDLDLMSRYIADSDWSNLRIELQKMDRLISEELKK